MAVAELLRPTRDDEILTFANEADRARLSAVGLKAYRNIAERWGLNNVEAAALIAASPSTWDRIKAGRWDGILNQDQLTRISALVGIFSGLHMLIVNDLNDRWPSLPNKGDLFGGQSPINAMIEGGIPRMLDVRRHVDALRMGL